jgi:cobalt-zinc-cadmium efflux system protein
LVTVMPGIEDIHHVHAWSLTQDRPMVTLHAKIRDAADGGRITAAIKGHLRTRYGVDHATVEIECAACADGHRAC